ncbi:MAG: hypothetical protein IRZ02_00130 [Acidothermus sp.]|nr:hypothetical protein [Acidothermus sp.]MCL6537412.1 hypothetical protein [Acidothermus sp.]
MVSRFSDRGLRAFGQTCLSWLRSTAAAEAAAGLAVAFAAAALSLLLDAAFPMSGGVRTPTPWRFVVLAVAALAAVLALWRRRRTRHANGTLYAITCLVRGMFPSHGLAERNAARGKRDLRPVTRWLPPPPPDDVWDLREDMEDLRRAVEVARQNDDEGTAYIVAPNLVWPAAVYLGYEAPFPDEIRVLELDDSVPGEKLVEIEVGTDDIPEDPQESPRVPEGWRLAVQCADHPDRCPHADVLLVISASNTLRDAPRDAVGTRECLWELHAVGEGHEKVAVVFGREPSESERRREKSLQRRDGAEQRRLAIFLAHLLHHALSFPAQSPDGTSRERTMTVLSMSTKTLNFALGWYLRRLPDKWKTDGAKHAADERGRYKLPQIWNRLNLLYYEQRLGRYVPTLVHLCQNPPHNLPKSRIIFPDRTTTTLVNLTPHSLRLYDGDACVLELPPAQTAARVSEKVHAHSTLHVSGHPIPLVDLTIGQGVADLPPPKEDVLYVVSRLTAQAVPDRDDLLFPFDEVRDEAGRVVGCRALARLVRAPEPVS